MLGTSPVFAKEKSGGIGMTTRQKPFPNPTRPSFDIGRACTGSSAPECASLCVNCFGKELVDKLKGAVIGEGKAACVEAALAIHDTDIAHSICGSIECIGSEKAAALGLGELVAACKGGKLVAGVLSCVSDYLACENAIANEKPIDKPNHCSLKPSVAKCKTSGAKSDAELFDECRRLMMEPDRSLRPEEIGICVKECVENSKTFNQSPCQTIQQTSPLNRDN